MSNVKVWENKSFWLILLGILCVGIVGLSLLVSWKMIINDNGEVEDTEASVENGEFSEEPEGLGVEEYIAEMEKRIEAAESNEEKAELYSMRAGTLYNRQSVGEGDFSQQILEDVYMAETLNPTSQSAYEIYVYENDFGDFKKAEEYLNKAKERGMELGGEISG